LANTGGGGLVEPRKREPVAKSVRWATEKTSK